MRRWSFALAFLVLGGVCGSFLATAYLHGDSPNTTPAIPPVLTSYRDVVKKVLPAVVSIESRVKARSRPARRRVPLDEGQIPEEFRRFFGDAEPGPMQDDDGNGPSSVGFGSGFLVDPNGVILTNNHVVDGADQVLVQLRDGRKFQSSDIKTDPKTDLAIVRIKASEPLPYLELGDSDQMEVGDRVLAIGAPFGLTGTVTNGIVSAKGRSIKVNMYEDFIQTDAAINPGNSGGPLVNLAGQVIGINSAIKSRSGGFQGIGLAVASNLAKNIMNQLEKYGTVHRGYLGVQVQDLNNPEVAKKLGLKSSDGVLVAGTFDNTPAAKGGIKEGDVIVSVNGKEVKDGRELQTVVAGLPLNKPVDVVVLREGKEKTLHVTVEEQPKTYGAAGTRPHRHGEPSEESLGVEKFGVEVTDLTPESADALGYREDAKGALITKVDPDGVGSEGGLRRGMLVMEVDRKPVASAKAFRDAVAAASLEKGVLLKVRSPQGGVSYLVLKAANAGAAK